MSWRDVLRDVFAPPIAVRRAAPAQFTKFGIGFCPGCRRLRGASSLECQDCGSQAPVAEDA